MIAQDDLRLVFLREEDIMEASGLCQIYKDMWFLVHPGTRELIFWQPDTKRRGKLIGATPQCNTSETVALKVKERIYPWADIKFFPRVAVPINLGDYV